MREIESSQKGSGIAILKRNCEKQFNYNTVISCFVTLICFYQFNKSISPALAEECGEEKVRADLPKVIELARLGLTKLK